MKKLYVYPKANKFIKKIREKPLKEMFYKAIDKILENPHIGKLKIGDLNDIRGLDFYHVGINYEIAYKIVEEDDRICIILVGARENFYEDLKRYLKELDL
jgi:mRNA-degrading endonuclease RelE of RelBE toxin-antitoxin system